jgi:hypothetical protein
MSESEPNGSEPATPPTFGAAAGKLRALGYEPVSALQRDGFDAMLSEHPVAVSKIGFLILAPVADETLAARVGAVLERFGLLSGPYRLGSDGAEVRPVRVGEKLRNPYRRELDGAIVFTESGIVPLDARWPRGTLLETRADDLPEISSEQEVNELFQQLGEAEFILREERRPKPRPRREGWLG